MKHPFPQSKRGVGLILVVLLCAGCDGGEPAAAAPERDAPASNDRQNRLAIRVRVATADVVPLQGVIAVPGIVRPFQKASIAAKIPGRVAERLTEPGDTLVEGAPLLRLDETDLTLAVDEAQIALRVASVDLSDGKRELERGLQLSRENTISESEMDTRRTAFDHASASHARAKVALAKAEQALADATIRAPFDGSVEAIEADVGEYLTPGTPVATMVDFSKARVRAGVTAIEAAQLLVGDPAEISFDSLGGSATSAKIRSLARTADAGSGTYGVELWLESPDPQLREGMIGEVRLTRTSGEEHTVVPRTAILRREGQTTLFVIENSADGPVARQRAIRSGHSDDEFVEIIEGANAGETVVIDGHFALADGSVVTIDDDNG